MAKGKAELHILTEFCPFAMGYVIITPEDRAIIIDGGTYTEAHNVKAHVGDREIAAWILTHTDGDHVGCLKDLIVSKDPILDKVVEEIVSEGDPYLYIIRTIDKPISRLAAKEKIAELAQVAPAEAKAIEAVKDLKKIEDAIYRPDIHKALRQAEAEGGETAAMLLAFYLISKERSEEEKAELIRIADKYPYLYQLFDREDIDDCMDGSNIDKLQEMVDYYYRADAHAMLTPAHAGKLCVMRKRLEEAGIIAPDEVETARLRSIMERKRD